MNALGNTPGLLKVALRELADKFDAAQILSNVWSMGGQVR
jgi:hypothetical protein